MIGFLKEYFQFNNWVPYEQSQRRRVMTFALWSTMAAGILLGLVNLYVHAVNAAIILFALSLLCLAGLRLNREGHYAAAGIMLSVMVLAALDFNLIDGNGSRDTGIVALPIFVMLGSLLFGKRSAPGFTLAAVGSTVLVTYLSVHGDIPRAYHASFNDGITISILIILSALLTWVIMDTLEKDSDRILQSEMNIRTTYQMALQNFEKLQQAEVELRKSEEKFRRVFETSRDFLYITDMDGKVIEINPTACAMTGYSTEELKSLRIQELFNDLEERRRAMNEIDEHGFLENLEIQAKRKDGTVFDALINVVGIMDTGGNLAGFQGSVKDISERKQAEMTLRESEERYRSLFQGVPIGLYRTTPAGEVLDFNRSAMGMLGYQDRAELIAHNASDFWVDPQKRTQIASIIDPDGTFDVETRMRRRDQTVIWVHNHGQAVRDAQGQILYYEGSLEDITQRKQTEEALSRQVEWLRALNTIERAVISSMDLNTVLNLLVQEIVKQLPVDAASVLLLNPQKQTLDFAAGHGFRTKALGFTSLKIGAGLAGQSAQERRIVYVANLTGLDNNPVFLRSIADEDFVAYFGVPLIAKDQMRGVLEIFHRSELDPDPNWLIFLETLAGQAAISIDNAHLFETTRNNLKETNALYRINQDLVATTDPEQLMEKVVNLLVESFEYYYVQIFVSDPETGDFVMRAGSGEIGQRLKREGYRLAPGEGIVGLTAETRKPFFTNDVDNVISFVRAPFLKETQSELAVPIKTGDEFLGLIDICQAPPSFLSERDVQLVSAVADQLAVALQKARLYNDLQNSLHQEQAARSQLIQNEKLAVAGRLLASVSHELNNPLQVIQNVLFLLKDEKGISTQGQEDLKIVLSEAERMDKLLERLRTTYQPAGTNEFQPVQINNIIADVRALMATHLRHAAISFEFHPDPKLPVLPGQSNQLKQVMLNLIVNATDAMSEGGRLTISTAWQAKHNEILITVSDTGPGIDPSILPNLFEAFVTTKANGTGLGLAISYEIILQHHGRIEAENNPQGGATFKIWLPLKNGDDQ